MKPSRRRSASAEGAIDRQPVRWLALLALCGWALTPAALAAQPDTRQLLRGYLEGLDAGAAPAIHGRRLHAPELVASTYRDRDHRPLWTGGGPLADQRTALLETMRQSADHGLPAAEYHQAALGALLEAGSAADLLALELLATDAFLTQARHRSTGAVSPRDLDTDWYLLAPEVDAVALLAATAAGTGSVAGNLDAQWPLSDEYHALVAHRARMLALGEVEVVQVPNGPLLRPGESGPRVVTLKERLFGPGEHTPLFDGELAEAVRAFQRAAGLEPDGLVGAATLEVMNASRFSWIDRIDANLERWRWLPAQEPDTYVRVNIAAFSLRVIQSGEDALRMDVIVGRPYRRTPVFTETIKYMVFNPFWNVPFRLAVQDKLPELKNDPAAMAAQGYEVRPEGSDGFVPVTDFDWSAVTRGNFRHLLRQLPGPRNALGQVKFMLPNSHAVYLHDTPARELFGKQERGFSSGCVRLSRPMDLAAWLLEHDGRSADVARIPQIVDSGETVTIYLNKPLPTYLVYFTAFTDDAGEVVFRRDLYQRDAAIVTALRAGQGS